MNLIKPIIWGEWNKNRCGVAFGGYPVRSITPLRKGSCGSYEYHIFWHRDKDEWYFGENIIGKQYGPFQTDIEAIKECEKHHKIKVAKTIDLELLANVFYGIANAIDDEDYIGRPNKGDSSLKEEVVIVGHIEQYHKRHIETICNYAEEVLKHADANQRENERFKYP